MSSTSFVTYSICSSWKVLKRMQYGLDNSGTRFRPLKIKIMQFPGEFCLSIFIFVQVHLPKKTSLNGKLL